MHASNDFIPPSPAQDRVDVGELILDRGRPTSGRGALDDELRHARPRLRRRRGRLVAIALALFAVVLASGLAVLIVVPLGWREQAIAGSMLIAGAIVFAKLSRSPTVTLALMAVSLFATLRYGY